MGRRGPAKTPSKVVQLRGRPGRRKVKKAEPKPKAGPVKCPAWLHKEAKAEWGRVADQLVALGVVTPIDTTVLAAYCQSYARWHEAEVELSETGSTVEFLDAEDVVKYSQQSPMISIAHKERLMMLRFAQELGLTPSARTRLETTARPTTDETERFLFG
ncbi:MAG: phage terminase small subunit P27 family [bacterium]|nr:phage terminase small subunit P27 family [bacterium]